MPITQRSSRVFHYQRELSSHPCRTCSTCREAPRGELAFIPTTLSPPLKRTEGRPYLGKVDVGHNHNVDSAGGILGRSAGITTGVILVLALAGSRLPRHGVLGEGHGVLGCGLGGSAAWENSMLDRAVDSVVGELTEVESGTSKGADHDATEDLQLGSACQLAAHVFFSRSSKHYPGASEPFVGGCLGDAETSRYHAPRSRGSSWSRP
jgi:hypothetical protein